MTHARLTDEQRASVVDPEPRRAIVAHPGTGKTTTLVELIAHLVTVRGRDPSCILATTFTRNAAGELRERVRARLASVGGGADLARRMLFGTSTSIALQIVRGHGAAVGRAHVATVYDEDDRRDVVRDIIATLKLSGATQSGVVRAFAAAAGVTPPADAAPPTGNEVRGAAEYAARLARAGAIDLCEIIPLACRILREVPRARTEWTRRARYLIVDEFHDTGPDEAALYALLAPVEFVVVGDPNQEIYAFRGTSNRFLLEAARGAGSVSYLTQSFRSGRAVVAAANRLIAHNPDQPPQPLRPAEGVGSGVVAVRCAGTPEDVDRIVVGACRKALAAGLTCAVLGRTNLEVERRRRGLVEAAVPVEDLSTPRTFFALPGVRAFHGYLRAMLNPADAVAERIVLEHWEGAPAADSATAFAARRQALLHDRPLLSILGWPGASGAPRDLAQASAAVADELGRYFAARGLTGRASDVASAALRVREWSADFMDEQESAPTLADYVDWLQHRELGDRRRAARRRREPHVEIGTIHAAKGLEWDVVVLAGMNDGVTPHARAERAEERRLAYVAFTRARTKLALVVGPDGDPSPFIAEAGLRPTALALSTAPT